MRFRKVISEKVDESGVTGAINAAIAANIGSEPRQQKVSSRQKVRVVQRGGKTEVFEHESDVDTEGESDG